MTPGTRTRAQRRLGARLHAAAAALAALALLQSSLAVLVDHDAAGRLPDHGHIHAGTVLPPHAHPYDEARTTGGDLTTSDPRVAFSAGADGGEHEGAESPVVFTTSQHGGLGSVVTPALAGGGLPELGRDLPERPATAPLALAVVDGFVALETPPPRS